MLVVLLSAVAGSASADINLTLHAVRHDNSRASGSDVWQLHVRPAGFPTFQLTSAGSDFKSSGTPSSGSATSTPFGTYQALAQATTGQWSLTIKPTPAAEASVYQLTFDLSAITPALLAQPVPTSPVPGAQYASLPALTYSDVSPHSSGEYGYLYLTGPPSGQMTSTLDLVNRSWHPVVAPETAGTFGYNVQYFGHSANVPVTATLVDGPDVGPVNARFMYEVETTVRFSVVPVPEPAAAAAGLLMATAALARPRRRHLTRGARTTRSDAPVDV
jgi:hypothetical protein